MRFFVLQLRNAFSRNIPDPSGFYKISSTEQFLPLNTSYFKCTRIYIYLITELNNQDYLSCGEKDNYIY